MRKCEAAGDLFKDENSDRGEQKEKNFNKHSFSDTRPSLKRGNSEKEWEKENIKQKATLLWPTYFRFSYTHSHALSIYAIEQMARQQQQKWENFLFA